MFDCPLCVTEEASTLTQAYPVCSVLVSYAFFLLQWLFSLPLVCVTTEEASKLGGAHPVSSVLVCCEFFLLL